MFPGNEVGSYKVLYWKKSQFCQFKAAKNLWVITAGVDKRRTDGQRTAEHFIKI
jgi:hypothetical protein